MSYCKHGKGVTVDPSMGIWAYMLSPGGGGTFVYKLACTALKNKLCRINEELKRKKIDQDKRLQ